MNVKETILDTMLCALIAIAVVMTSFGLFNTYTTKVLRDSEQKITVEKTLEVEEVVPVNRKHVTVKVIEVVKKSLTQRELIDSYVEEVCAKYKMDPALIKSIIYQESRFNPSARNRNCLGLMQVSTRWHADRAARLGVTNFHDPYGNILLGVDYLSELTHKYKDMRLVLMIYNMGYKDTLKLYKQGKISNYAKSVLARAEEYRKGE